MSVPLETTSEVAIKKSTDLKNKFQNSGYIGSNLNAFAVTM